MTKGRGGAQAIFVNDKLFQLTDFRGEKYASKVTFQPNSKSFRKAEFGVFCIAVHAKYAILNFEKVVVNAKSFSVL